MRSFRRGIEPELLVSQVKNTMPYLFQEAGAVAILDAFPPAQVLVERERNPELPLEHFEYFKLCVSAHYLTCGTPVPTDVDNQIRSKLWPEGLPLDTALEMASFVIESRSWDFRLVSSRFSYGAAETVWKDEPVSGHLGEWFTLSSAAYCALKRYDDPRAAQKRDELLSGIRDEVYRHSEIFGSLWRAGDGLGCLKASASIAHNFGDLDRVIEMWDLDIADPLRLECHKLGMSPFDPNGKLRHQGRLWVAGELYKSRIAGSAMALENHRHFALRKPKCLRRSPELRIPIAPFLDDWGRQVAKEFQLPDGSPSAETLEVVAALLHGWDRLSRTVGYGRALRSIREAHPGSGEIEELLQAHKRADARHILETPREVFENLWNDEAIKEMDDIPSRA